MATTKKKPAKAETHAQNDNAHLLKNRAYINGAWVSAKNKKTFDVTNPATQEKIASVPDCNAADTKAAIDAAFTAFPAWRKTLVKDRANILRKWAALIEANIDVLANILTTEQGKPLAESKVEISGGAAMIEWAAEEARRMYGDTIPAFKDGARVITTREPIGVVGAITPWNFPHSMITRKVGPAIAAGNTVVLKPAEATPLSALALAALAHQAGLPKGVLNIVTSAQAKVVGATLTGDDRVRKISFTGSTEVGRLLVAQSAPTLKKVSMELGGNAPFIVFDDADLEKAVAGAIASKFRNAGQTCICANRLYVQKGIYTEFLKSFQKSIEKLKLGTGQEKGVQIGPLINHDAIDKVTALLKDATGKGAKVLTGGHKTDDYGLGWFFEPTLIAPANQKMRLAREEIFGPVAAIFPFKTEEEVIKRANDTEFGLAAYFYTKDLGRAFRVAEGLEYGMVGVNEPVVSSESIPFGGVKQSGYGREGGPQSLEDYSLLKYTLLGGI